MKMTKIALAMGLATLGISGMAQAELSANIGATSNYLWRGLTQTDNGPAVSGGIDYNHDSGFYVGTWASNVDFKDASGSQTELDLYAGFSGEASSIGYDVGVIYYAYPLAVAPDDKLDFTEITAGLSYGPVSAGIAYTVHTEAGGDDNNVYYHLEGSHDLGNGWSVGATVGHYDFDAKTVADYSHAQLDVTKSAGDFGDFTFALSNVFDQDSIGTYDDSLIPVISWSKSF